MNTQDKSSWEIDYRIFVVILAAIIVVFSVINHFTDNSSDTVNITIAESTISNQAALSHIARAKGYWEDEGLNVQLSSFSAGRLALDAVLGGGAEFGTVAQTPLAMAAFRNADYKVLAEITNVSNELSVVARKSSGISSPSDLVGKRVAFFSGTQSDYFLTLFLRTHGINRDDIVEISMSPPDSVSAIINGTVDAIAVWRPHSLKAANALGDDSISLPSEGIYTAVMTVISKGDFAESNRETVTKFLNGLIKAEQFLITNPEEAIDIVAQNVQLDSSELAQYFNDYQFTVKLSDTILNALQDQGQWAIDTEIVDSSSTLPMYENFLLPYGLNSIDSSRVTYIFKVQ